MLYIVLEIKTYALRIGIDPENEPQLLPLANEGLMKPLPPGWKPWYLPTTYIYYSIIYLTLIFKVTVR